MARLSQIEAELFTGQILSTLDIITEDAEEALILDIKRLLIKYIGEHYETTQKNDSKNIT